MVEVDDREESQSGQEERIEEYVTRDTFMALQEEMEAFKATLREELNALTSAVESHTRDIEELKQRLSEEMARISKKMAVIGELNDRIIRLSRRLRHISEEIGLEEELDVNKVPPNILETVYQYTLDDAVRAMRHMLGVHDAEKEVQNILEEVRHLTSGTELFRYVDGWIKIAGMARAIESGMISAKQIHITYTELLRKIQERIPGYRPKNFRALIKTKGQEFAIGKTTENFKHMLQLDAVVEKLRLEMQHAFLRIEQQAHTLETLANDIRRIDGSLTELKREISAEMSEIRNTINGLQESVEKLMETVMSREVEEGEEPEEHQPSEDEIGQLILNSIPTSGISLDDLKEMFGEFMGPEDVESHVESLLKAGYLIEWEGKLFNYNFMKEEVLASIPEGGISYSSLRRSFSWMGALFDNVLTALVEEGRIWFREYGKGRRVFKNEEKEETGGE